MTQRSADGQSGSAFREQQGAERKTHDQGEVAMCAVRIGMSAVWLWCGVGRALARCARSRAHVRGAKVRGRALLQRGARRGCVLMSGGGSGKEREASRRETRELFSPPTRYTRTPTVLPQFVDFQSLAVDGVARGAL